MSTHLADYLTYYRTLNEPGYAVLVTGQWGVGKTFQVRQCISEGDCYYVSLFGLRTQDEAHAAVYAAYAPNLEKFGQGISTLQSAAENAGGLISLAGAATGWLSAALRRQIKPDRPLIFDDLERCGMGLEEMMGVFSTYVEHLGFQVVLIADEEKLIEKHNKYAAAKEKVVGHTAKIGPLTSDAFDTFVATTDAASRKFIETQKPLVLEVFDASGCMSLRILRHVIFDLARLHRALETRHVEHETAITEVIGLFAACGIEVRLGRLTATDLKDRAGRRMAFEMRRQAAKNKEVEKPPFVDADDRYPMIDLESQILSDQVLEDVFANGVFSAELIRLAVNKSAHFLEPGDVSSWSLVSSFAELGDDVFQEALSAMNNEFDNRKVTSSGDMLHIFALRLMMADEEISGTSIEAACAECIQYIDDLLAEGRLPPRELSWRWWQSIDYAFGGQVYWVRPPYKDNFKAIWDRLISAREQALEVTFPERMAEIMATLESDGKKFYRQLCHTAGHDSPYAHIPVLKSMSPCAFVDAWLASPRPAWSWVSRALEDRLEPHRVQNELASEKEWALEVLQELEARRDALTGFERLRIHRVIPYKLQRLQNEDAEDKAEVDDGSPEA